MALKRGVDEADPVDGVGVGVEAEPDGAAADPAGQDAAVSGKLLHEKEGVARSILVDGVEQLARTVVFARSPRSEILLVLEDQLMVEGLLQPAQDRAGVRLAGKNVGHLNNLIPSWKAVETATVESPPEDRLEEFTKKLVSNIIIVGGITRERQVENPDAAGAVPLLESIYLLLKRVDGLLLLLVLLLELGILLGDVSQQLGEFGVLLS